MALGVLTPTTSGNVPGGKYKCEFWFQSKLCDFISRLAAGVGWYCLDRKATCGEVCNVNNEYMPIANVHAKETSWANYRVRRRFQVVPYRAADQWLTA